MEGGHARVWVVLNHFEVLLKTFFVSSTDSFIASSQSQFSEAKPNARKDIIWAPHRPIGVFKNNIFIKISNFALFTYPKIISGLFYFDFFVTKWFFPFFFRF